MDPLSITLASVTLIDAIAKVSKTGTSFLVDVRNAKSDIEAVIGESDSIKVVITLIANEFQQRSVDHVPKPLHEKIVGIIDNCVNLVADIDKSLAGYGSTSAQKCIKWATSGKREIAKARAGLGAHRVALELALEMLNMQVVKEIRDGTIELTSEARETKDQTSRILEGNRNIRDDVQRILQEISHLQAMLPSERPNSIMLQRYLDELSNYVESVGDGSDQIKSNSEFKAASESQEQDNLSTSVAPLYNMIRPEASIVERNPANGGPILSETRTWTSPIFEEHGDKDSRPIQGSLLRVLDVENDGVEIAREFGITKEGDMLTYKTELLKDTPKFRYISIGRPDPGNVHVASLKVSSYLRSIYQIPQSFFELSVSPQSSLGGLYIGAIGTYVEGFTSFLNKAPTGEASTGKTTRQWRLWYILRTIKKCTSVSDAMWTVEPVAVYHSFDLETFGSFWLTIPDMDKIKYGAYEAFSAGQRNFGSTSCVSSFIAALETQLLFLRLTEENWESYIGDLENILSQTMEKVKPTAINESPRCHPFEIEADDAVEDETSQDIIERFNDAVQGVFSVMQKSHKHDGVLRQQARRNRLHRSTGIKEVREKKRRQLDAELEDYMRIDAVNIQDKKELHRIEFQVQDALLNLQLNLTVLRQTKSHYQNLQDRMLPPGPKADQMQIEMKEFLYNAGQIETNLAVQHRRLETLDRHIRDGISLCDGIIQYHSLRVSKIFNERAELSSGNMERIARRTEQETVSMHIITLVTLTFLPGTFVATLFSTDLTSWQSLDDVDLGLYHRSPFLHNHIRLFVTVIFLTTIIWVGLFCISRRRKAREIGKLRKEEAWKLV